MKLAQIQQALKAPKDKYNPFSKSYYRNIEDILEAAKPLLGQAVILLNDDIVNLGSSEVKDLNGVVKKCDTLFVKSTATYKSGDEEVSVNAFAEISTPKGMSAAQATGAASTYARKYALGGLLLVDGSKDDPDAQEKTTITMEVLTQEIQEREVDQEKLCKFLGIASLSQLNKNKYAEALEAIKRKPKVDNVLKI